MKKHLILMAAMISLGITNNCEAQGAEKKKETEACEKAEDCKSDVCTDKKCAQGTKERGETGWGREECASGRAQCPYDAEHCIEEGRVWECL